MLENGHELTAILTFNFVTNAKARFVIFPETYFFPSEAIVITQRHHQNDIQKALSDTCQLRLDFVSIPPDVDWGTADSLRHIKDKIKVGWFCACVCVT